MIFSHNRSKSKVEKTLTTQNKLAVACAKGTLEFGSDGKEAVAKRTTPVFSGTRHLNIAEGLVNETEKLTQ